MPARVRFAVTVLVSLTVASAAQAQWAPVPQVPATTCFSVWAKGDTIAAGADTVAFVSTDAGVTWKQTRKVAAGVTSVEAVRVRDGRLYAGTYGQGVFVSDDLGESWLDYSQGLVGGIANSQLYIADLLIHGDSLYAATAGDGPWVRNLAAPGAWTHFGDVLEPNQASNMNAIATDGTRLLAAAGANGTVFYRDPGQPDWMLSWLDNLGIVAGLSALSALWTGEAWLVGANTGVFRSATGASPWAYTDVGLSPLFVAHFARRDQTVFACFGNGAGSTIEFSTDDGAGWNVLDSQPFVFTYGLAASGQTLYAARVDGLWRRSIAAVSTPGIPAPARLGLAVAGPQPVGDEVRLRFSMPEAGRAVLEIFDAAGRRVAERLEEVRPAGPSELAWQARGQAPGVYFARLSAGRLQEVARFVRVR